MAFFGWYQIAGTAPASDISGILLGGAWLFLGGAVVEELLFRGIIFGGSHLANPNATIIGALAIAITA